MCADATQRENERERGGSSARRRSRSIIYTYTNTNNRGKYIGSAAGQQSEEAYLSSLQELLFVLLLLFHIKKNNKHYDNLKKIEKIYRGSAAERGGVPVIVAGVAGGDLEPERHHSG